MVSLFLFSLSSLSLGLIEVSSRGDGKTWMWGTGRTDISSHPGQRTATSHHKTPRHTDAHPTLSIDTCTPWPSYFQTHPHSASSSPRQPQHSAHSRPQTERFRWVAFCQCEQKCCILTWNIKTHIHPAQNQQRQNHFCEWLMQKYHHLTWQKGQTLIPILKVLLLRLFLY